MLAPTGAGDLRSFLGPEPSLFPVQFSFFVPIPNLRDCDRFSFLVSADSSKAGSLADGVACPWLYFKSLNARFALRTRNGHRYFPEALEGGTANIELVEPITALRGNKCRPSLNSLLAVRNGCVNREVPRTVKIQQAFQNKGVPRARIFHLTSLPFHC